MMRLDRGEFFSCHMTAVTRSLFQGIQGRNDSALASVDAATEVMRRKQATQSLIKFSETQAPAQIQGGISRPDRHRPCLTSEDRLDQSPSHRDWPRPRYLPSNGHAR
jgi:hypothetical protein